MEVTASDSCSAIQTLFLKLCLKVKQVICQWSCLTGASFLSELLWFLWLLNCLNIPITQTVEHCNFSPDFSNYPIPKDYDKTCIPFRFLSRFEKVGFPSMNKCPCRYISFAFWKTLSLQYYVPGKLEIVPEWALVPIRIKKDALHKLVTFQLALMIWRVCYANCTSWHYKCEV